MKAVFAIDMQCCYCSKMCVCLVAVFEDWLYIGDKDVNNKQGVKGRLHELYEVVIELREEAGSKKQDGLQ